MTHRSNQFTRVLRASSDSAWPLRRADGTRWCDAPAGRNLPLGSVTGMPESIVERAKERGARIR